MTDVIGPEFGPYYELGFPDVDGSNVARITIDAGSRPAYHRAANGSEFLIRVGNTTQPLDPQEAHDYIDMHWAA